MFAKFTEDGFSLCAVFGSESKEKGSVIPVKGFVGLVVEEIEHGSVMDGDFAIAREGAG